MTRTDRDRIAAALRRRDKGVRTLTFAEMLFPLGAATVRASRPARSHSTCQECGKPTHPERLTEQRLLMVCPVCKENPS